jgi:hypothetical protein
VNLLRVGTVALVAGISMMIVTTMRALPIGTGVQSSYVGMFGPFLLEPRETIVVLRDVDPPTELTLSLIDQKLWNPNQNVSQAVTAFSIGNLMQSDTVIFDVPSRGLYYVILSNETGLSGQTSIRLDQRGFAPDLLWVSAAILFTGVVIIAVQGTRVLRTRRKPF